MKIHGFILPVFSTYSQDSLEIELMKIFVKTEEL